MRIAIIGCGEVGGAYARALHGHASLSLCDIVSEGRPGTLASDLDLPLHTTPGDWLTECDLAIAAVPGAESPLAAASALPFMAPDGLYIDISTGAPDGLARSAKDFAEAKRGFVDVAIMGAIALTGGQTSVLIAGPEPERASTPFALMKAPVKILEGGNPGDAVALKLLRSVVIKGLECLSIECLTAAEHLGVREQVLDILGDLDESTIRDFMGALVTTHLEHAERRMHEMQEATEQLRKLGFDPAVTAALEQRYKATLAGRDKEPPGEEDHRSVDAALAWLTRIGREGAG